MTCGWASHRVVEQIGSDTFSDEVVLRVSTPTVLLASALSKAGSSVSVTRKVRLQVVSSLQALMVGWHGEL